MDVRRTQFSIEREYDTHVRVSTSVARTVLSHEVSNEELSKLKFHSGPVDRRALTARNPHDLLDHIIKTLVDMGLEVQRTADEYKIKVTRPAHQVTTTSVPIDRKQGSKFATMLTSFPLTIVKRLKYLSQLGQLNYGYDSVYSPEEFGAVETKKEVRFQLAIHRIRNLNGLLIVDVKRLRGDIWQFKGLYHELVPKLKLGEFDAFQSV